MPTMTASANSSQLSQLEAASAGWSPENRRAMLDYWSADAKREVIKTAYTDASDLAVALDPRYVVTEALKLIATDIETVLRKPRHNLLVTMPPQSGKSFLCSVYTPLRALMLNPNCRIILATYGDALAAEHSQVCRALIDQHGSGVVDQLTGAVMEDKLGYRLAAGQNKIGIWKVAGARGGMVATGLGSSITGRPADCVSGDTYIFTEHGRVTAERAYRERHTLIWAYDHATGLAGWRRVAARRRIDSRRVVTVDTETGHLLRCTPDHRIYTRRGYIPAGRLRPSDQILSFGGADPMRSVPDTVPDPRAGHPQSGSARAEPVLLHGVPEGGTQRHEPDQGMPGMRGSGAEEPQTDVLAGMPAATLCRETPHPNLRSMCGGVPAQVVADGVLQPRLRRPGALREDDRPRQLALQDRDQLRELVQGDAAADFGTRRPPLRRLRSNTAPDGIYPQQRHGDPVTADSAPHQRATRRQPTREPDHDVRDMPRDPPQIEYVAVSRVSDARGDPISVYDFQVDGAGNFFANGLLVHNCLIIDDPYKNMMEADSANHRRKVAEWFNSVAQTRLSPQASIILVQTRWSPEDLAGQLIADTRQVSPRFKTWKHINIPAQAEEGIPDALSRPPGQWLVSARGHTPAQWEATRRAVGERTWYALYQGVPTPPAGGLFARAWFEPHADPPETPIASVVGIDPADTGDGDDTGIIAAALNTDGTVVLTEDWSGKFTSDTWARRAVVLALQIGAREIAMEAYTTAVTYEQVLKRAYRAIHADALTKRRAGVELTPVEMRALSEYPPFTIYKWRAGAKVDAIGRSSLLRQALETRRARTVEDKLATFEDHACDWQPGQHQPDRVAAAIIAHDRLAALAGAQMTVATPENGRPDPVAKLHPDYVPSRLARRLGR